MKIHTIHAKKNAAGFTLIEMIGVLAVISILAAVLMPKIFEAINSSRVSNAAVSCNTVKTAVGDHFAKFGTLPTLNGGALPGTGGLAYDANVLVQEGFLDKPLATKIGDNVNTRVDLVTLNTTDNDLGHVVAASPAAATIISGEDANFDLNGVGGNDVVGTYAVVAMISNVMEEDARSLSKLIDGPTATLSPTSSDDHAGRVKFDAPAAAGGSTTVYVYLTHR